jgi:NIPSNAP
MTMRHWLWLVAMMVAMTAGNAAMAQQGSTAKDSRVFEMRTYHAAPGKLEALNARFRNHTNRLFVKHGMTLVGYWMPLDEKDGAGKTLVYILAYPDRAAREAAWEAFRKDADWIKAKTESEVGGALVEKVDSMMLTPTDYSPIK